MIARQAVFVLLAVLALMLAGCTNTQEADTGTTMDDEANELGETAQTVEVGLGEWYVDMTPSTVTSGPTTFDVTNEGTIVHSLEVEGQGIDERSRDLEPGESQTMTIDLVPGEYDAYCPIGNHAERGMRTQFTVQEPSE